MRCLSERTLVQGESCPAAVWVRLGWGPGLGGAWGRGGRLDGVITRITGHEGGGRGLLSVHQANSWELIPLQQLCNHSPAGPQTAGPHLQQDALPGGGGRGGQGRTRCQAGGGWGGQGGGCERGQELNSGR